MNKWAAYDIFGSMRLALPHEQQLCEQVLENIFIPLGRSIMDIEVDYCDFCHKKTEVSRQYYHYNIDCDCCGGQYHFEYVRYCKDCNPEPPRWINAQVSPIESN